MQRAYSLLSIKAIDEERRIITGMATTPETDRMGDIVEPLGAEFELPLPVLWQHESWESPVGNVTAAQPTKDGIPVTIQMEQDDVAGPLKDRLDYAWRAVKKKLVRGLSIGFAPIESTDIEGTWGRRFIKWAWLELSIVTIPANAEATIQTVKSLDQHRAASGAQLPGASGPVKLLSPKSGGRTVLNISEQISALEATRAAKSAERLAIQEAASASGNTKDEAQREAFDTLGAEIKAIDAELKDFRDLEGEQARAAKPVGQPARAIDAGVTRDPASPSIVALPKKLPPGIGFARVARCIALAHMGRRDVGLMARSLYPDDALIEKASVAAGTSASGNWAEHLTGTDTAIFADFVEFLRPMTILGKFGTGGVPALRRVPFRVPLVGQTGGGAGYWVGEGKAKPLTSFDFSRTTLGPLKVANIAVVSMETLRDSSPSAEAIVRDSLAAALAERQDTDFVDPSKSASAGVSPASITNGLVAINASGVDADAVRADIKALVATFIAANNRLTSGVWIMPATTALGLSLMVNALGQPEFPGISMAGGTLFGMPVIVSEYVPTDSTGANVILANAADIYFADDGGVTVDMSTEASLEMSTTPSHESTTPTPAELVSLWQTNNVGFRAERTLNWAKRRATAVALLNEVNWGSAA